MMYDVGGTLPNQDFNACIANKRSNRIQAVNAIVAAVKHSSIPSIETL
jgi:hypothetical protein